MRRKSTHIIKKYQEKKPEDRGEKNSYEAYRKQCNSNNKSFLKSCNFKY